MAGKQKAILVIKNPTDTVIFNLTGEPVATSETWVLNENLGYLEEPSSVFSATLNLSDGNTLSLDFLSIGTSGNIVLTDSNVGNGVGTDRYIWTSLFSEPIKQDYYAISITFTTSPTGEVLSWLEENAVKQ